MSLFILPGLAHSTRLRWVQLPALLLVALLQRTPVLRVLASADTLFLAGSGTVLKSIFAGSAALAIVDTLVGATQLTANPASPASATVGQPFQAAVAITGAPLVAGSYEVRGNLPPGLSIAGLDDDLINASSFSLSGSPTTAGTYTLNIRAWQLANKQGLGGTPTFDYVINVTGGAQAAPAFTTQPQSQTVAVGANVSFTVAVSGDPAPTLQWQRDGANLAGATSATLDLTNVQTSHAGNYTVVATNAAGTATSATAQLTVSAPTNAPTITFQPRDILVRSGTTGVLRVSAEGASSYQWRRDGSPLTGATGSTLLLDPATSSDAGSYTVIVGNGEGSVTSEPAQVSVVGSGSSRIANLSVRTNLSADGLLIVGFYSVGEKSMLLRAAGPSLRSVAPDLTGLHPDPRIELYDGATRVQLNEDWDTALLPAFAPVGAFPFLSGERDAALLETVSAARTAHVGGAGSGIVLVEAYDSGGSGRLSNVSARNRVGTGGDVLIAGFFVSGTVGKTLLIRGVGPKLADLGVPNVLQDPKLEIYTTTNVKIAENDDWDNSLVAVANRAGAGGLPIPPGGKDAGLIITLNPGGYTAIVSGVGQTTGEALAEVYEVP